MEPPPIGGGNLAMPRSTWAPNGALQWSRLQSEAVIDTTGEGPEQEETASMEPPPIGGGNQVSLLAHPRLSLLQWSRLQSEAVIAQIKQLNDVEYELQWSRLQSEAVIGRPPHWPAHPDIASMEPPPIGGGNEVARRAGVRLDDLLQWSRLQSEAVIGRSHVKKVLDALASMEPPPIGGGNRRTARRNQRHKNASMEPPPIGGGNEHRRSRPLYRLRASMEPPPIGGGNPLRDDGRQALRPRFNGAASNRRR